MTKVGTVSARAATWDFESHCPVKIESLKEYKPIVRKRMTANTFSNCNDVHTPLETLVTSLAKRKWLLPAKTIHNFSIYYSVVAWTSRTDLLSSKGMCVFILLMAK